MAANCFRLCAPINVESKTALRTALWAKNLPLALQLLQKGVKQNLSNFDCFYNFAFLETIARTDPHLFREGFAVVDEGKAEPRETEARKNFEKLLEACSAVPNLSEGGYAILEYSTPENRNRFLARRFITPRGHPRGVMKMN